MTLEILQPKAERDRAAADHAAKQNETFERALRSAMDDMRWIGVRQGILACARWLRLKGHLDTALALTLHSDEIAQRDE